MFAMAQSTPELTPSLGSGEISSKMEEPGNSGESVLQKRDFSSPRGALPRNFLWRLGGGRRNSSSDLTSVQRDMAVDVPVLRETFDPWSNDRHNEGEDGQDERCKGCSKISQARAARTAAAEPPHALKRSESTVLFKSEFPRSCPCPGIYTGQFPRNTPTHAPRPDILAP